MLYLAQVWVFRSFVTDDAFISLRYARNFAEGFGPVWNPGGPVVEGFSNPLLVLLEALTFAAGLDAVVFARGLGVVAGLGVLVVTWFWGRHVLGDWRASAAAVFVAAAPGLAYWSVGGLETLPMAFVLTSAALLLARPDGGPARTAGLLLALLPWIRPEGLALAGALVFCSEIGGLRDSRRRGATVRRLAWLALVPVLSQAVLQTLRWTLYGNIVPNSVIFKAGTGRLGVVTLRFLAEYGIYVALALIALWRVRVRLRLLAVPAAVYLVASLSFLNSVNQFSRLLLPILPLWAILAAAALPVPAASEGRRRMAAIAVVPLIAVLMVAVMPASLPTGYATSRRYMGCRHVARLEAGEWLRERLRPGDRYVVGDAGLLPFVADGSAHDLFSLNEASLQETGPTPEPDRADVALDVRPRYIVLASESPNRLRPFYPEERFLRRDDRFAEYALRTVAGAPSYGLRRPSGPTTRRCDYYLHVFEAGSP